MQQLPQLLVKHLKISSGDAFLIACMYIKSWKEWLMVLQPWWLHWCHLLVTLKNDWTFSAHLSSCWMVTITVNKSSWFLTDMSCPSWHHIISMQGSGIWWYAHIPNRNFAVFWCPWPYFLRWLPFAQRLGKFARGVVAVNIHETLRNTYIPKPRILSWPYICGRGDGARLMQGI